MTTPHSGMKSGAKIGKVLNIATASIKNIVFGTKERRFGNAAAGCRKGTRPAAAPYNIKGIGAGPPETNAPVRCRGRGTGEGSQLYAAARSQGHPFLIDAISWAGVAWR